MVALVAPTSQPKRAGCGRCRTWAASRGTGRCRSTWTGTVHRRCRLRDGGTGRPEHAKHRGRWTNGSTWGSRRAPRTASATSRRSGRPRPHGRAVHSVQVRGGVTVLRPWRPVSEAEAAGGDLLPEGTDAEHVGHLSRAQVHARGRENQHQHLYHNSTLALDGATGETVGHYQNINGRLESIGVHGRAPSPVTSVRRKTRKSLILQGVTADFKWRRSSRCRILWVISQGSTRFGTIFATLHHERSSQIAVPARAGADRENLDQPEVAGRHPGGVEGASAHLERRGVARAVVGTAGRAYSAGGGSHGGGVREWTCGRFWCWGC